MKTRKTIEQSVFERLVNCGMFDSQALAVLELVKADTDENMHGRWSDSFEDYQPVVEPLIWSNVKRIALIWIDENKPKAWFREMFVDK